MTIAVAARKNAVPLGAIFLAGGAMAALGIALLHLDRLPITLCAFKSVTGLPCFTCGTTRALARLILADLRGAVAMNPLATAAGLAIVPWGLADLALMARGQALSIEIGPAVWRVLRVVVPVALLANWAWLIVNGV